MVRVRTVTTLLLLLWGLCFGAGAYEVYLAWADHQGSHGPEVSPPPNLPALPPPPRAHFRLGT